MIPRLYYYAACRIFRYFLTIEIIICPRLLLLPCRGQKKEKGRILEWLFCPPFIRYSREEKRNREGADIPVAASIFYFPAFLTMPRILLAIATLFADWTFAFRCFAGICDQWAWRKVKRPLGSGSMPATLGVGPCLSPVWPRFWTIYRLNRSTRFWGPASARSNVGSTVSSYLVRNPSSFLRELSYRRVNSPYPPLPF